MTETPAPKPRKGSMHRFLGRAGEARVMSELLIRGYNVAAPQVDEGHDLFVVSSPNATLVRAVQVKAASPSTSNLNRFQFNNVNLSLTPVHERFFFFVFYQDEVCRDFLILNALDLILRCYHRPDISDQTPLPDNFTFNISMELTNEHAAFWGGQAPLNDWRDFPTIPR